MDELQGKRRTLKYNQVIQAYHDGEIREEDYRYYIKETKLYIARRRRYDLGLINENELSLASERVRGLYFYEIKNNEIRSLLIYNKLQ